MQYISVVWGAKQYTATVMRAHNLTSKRLPDSLATVQLSSKWAKQTSAYQQQLNKKRMIY